MSESTTQNAFWLQLQTDDSTQLGAELPDLTTTVAVIPLRQYGFIQADGPDGANFFQGQTTADFRQVSLTQARRGAYATPKGRMLANFTATKVSDESLLLKVRRDTIENTLTVLAKYAVFSKLRLDNSSDQWAAIGVSGQNARGLLQSALGTVPEAQWQASQLSDGLIIQCDQLGQRFEVWLEANKATAVWKKLLTNPEAKAFTSELWDWLELADGCADVCAATSEEFLPQMLNYDLTGAVNFKKGCYTGQEVIARLHFKGTAKRRLFSAHIAGEAGAGDGIYRPGSSQSVGNIANILSNGVAAIVLATSEANAEGLTLENGAAVSRITSLAADDDT